MVNGKVRTSLRDTAILPVEKPIAELKIKILLVDDSNCIRETLNSYLAPQPDFEIVGSVDNAQAALEQIKTSNPDIVLMDIEMPGIDGLEATRLISQQSHQTKVIVLSIHDEDLYINQVLDAGAKGYLLKTTPMEELAHSIRFVHRGYLQFSPGVLEKLNSVGGAIPPLSSLAAPNSSEIRPAASSQIESHDWSYATKELLDSLPQLWSRGLLYFLVIFVGIALPWAVLSEVDQTGTARGRLEPLGKTVRLDAPVTGTVAKINVEEGEMVEAGEILVELESELVRSELQQLQEKLEGQQTRLHQLKLLASQLQLVNSTQGQQTQAQDLEKQAQVEQARQRVETLSNSYNLQKEEKQTQVNQAKQQLAHSETAYTLADSRLAKAKREVERYRQLWEQGVVPETSVVEKEDLAEEKKQLAEQAASDVEQAKLLLAEQQSSYQNILHQAKADISQAKLHLQEQQRGYQSLNHSGKLAILKSSEQLKTLETDTTTLVAEIAQTQSQIKSLQYQLSQRVLTAPTDGTVYDLSIERPGAVVQPGTTIAEIAPQKSNLILQAQMATTESGSLKAGMPVKMKFDAYPFQDYGIVSGKLIEISPTSRLTETAQGQVATYDLEIELEQDCVNSGSRCIALRPGDTATAEVIVRQRRVIDFILDPFKKLQKGGLEL